MCVVLVNGNLFDGLHLPQAIVQVMEVLDSDAFIHFGSENKKHNLKELIKEGDLDNETYYCYHNMIVQLVILP